ncbi:hypothetical protein MRB53_011758 [Persea americana]|uniref:Uncharacterized protein n=1 Tax=Persea americana TaxID=3435 RepID=A0ACC2LWL6_PERAE|nr:hypothetical protein MRB53_011758 [Persea americana]
MGIVRSPSFKGCYPLIRREGDVWEFGGNAEVFSPSIKPKITKLTIANFRSTALLELNSDEVLRSEDALDAIDVAVSNWAGIVLLDAGEGSGGRLYEAAHALKLVIGEMTYLLIRERVQVAAAIGASGVVLSDRGW